MSLLSQASLVVTPNAFKASPPKLYSVIPSDGSGDMTSARATTATRVNENGLIETVASNVPRIDYTSGEASILLEPQRTNLIKYPLSFSNAYWIKSGASIQGDPSTAGSELITSTTDRDFSGANNWVNNNLSSFDSTTGAVLTLATTAIGQSCSLASINALGSAGKMYKITFDVNSITGTWELQNSSGAWLGINITRYTFNTTGTYTLYTTDFTGGFSISSRVVTGNVVFDNFSIKEVQGYSSPSVDYPTSAFKLVESSALATQHTIGTSSFATGVVNVTLSVFVKQASNRYIAISDNQWGAGYAVFDITNGINISYGGVGYISNKITALANGWYRISVTFTVNGTGNCGFVINTLLPSYTSGSAAAVGNRYDGDGTSGVYIYGAQLEAGSYPTSLTFTSLSIEGSTVTRNADNLEVSNLDNVILAGTSWTASGEFIKKQDKDSAMYLFFAYYLSSLNLFRIRDYTTYVQFKIFTTSEVNYNHYLSLGDTTKWAIRAKTDGSYSVYVNGTSIGETNGTFQKLDKYIITGAFAPTSTNNLIFYNTALTDTELTALTTL